MARTASRLQAQAMHRHIYPIMVVIIDAGVLYAVMLIIVIIVYYDRNLGYLIVRNMVLSFSFPFLSFPSFSLLPIAPNVDSNLESVFLSHSLSLSSRSPST